MVADEFAKAAAIGEASGEEILERYCDETSLSQMTRVATEARSRKTAEWIFGRVRAERRYRPHAGEALRHPPLCRVSTTLVGPYSRLLSGHAPTGSRHRRIKKIDKNECRLCTTGEPQSHHNLSTRCQAWTPQAGKMWKETGTAREWEHPCIPLVRLLWDGGGFRIIPHDQGRMNVSRESAPCGGGGAG